MSDDLTREIARTIWETSRRDEGTISVTGANIIAAALSPLIEDYFERTVVAVAWDEGYTAGHMTARAVNPEYPAPATNPYLAEEEDNA